MSLADAALWAGQHPLPLFVAALGVLLLTTGAVGWGARRWIGRARQRSTNAGLTVTCSLCSILVLAGVATFVGLAAQVKPDSALGRADQVLTDTLRASAQRPVMQVFSAFTRLADTQTLSVLCIGVAALLLCSRQRWLMLPWVVAIIGNGTINHSLKQVFGRARPLQPDGFFVEHGYSFPSGHSSGCVVACGMLAYLATGWLPGRWHLTSGLIAVALAFTICASRVFLQVHYASDVLAGIASGTVWLAICLGMTEIARVKFWSPAERGGHPK